jgi:nucleoid DNA-binding protein
MIRYELIKRISDKFGVEEIDAGVFVDRIFESMAAAFSKGKKINIPEFGKFNVTNKTVGGIKQMYVSFSPSKNFADLVNKNFTDLEPLVLNAYNVKDKEILKVKEIFPDYDDEEYLYFEFESSEEESRDEVSEAENLFIKQETAEEDSVFPEEAPAGYDEPEEEIVTEEETAEETVTEEKVFSDEEIPADEEEVFEGKVVSEEEILSTDEFSSEEITDEEISETEEDLQATVTSSSLLSQTVFTESTPIFEEEIREEKEPDNIEFDEETVANVISQQNVFADNPVDIILPEGLLLKEFNENPEEQIAENEKIIDEINNTSSLSIRVSLKDDINIDHIKEEIFDILVKREEIIKELRAYEIPEETKHEEIKPIPVIEEDIQKPDLIEEITEEPAITETYKAEDDSSYLFAELEKRIRELDELSKKEEILKADLNAPMSQEMQIFEKLIDDSKTEIKEEEKHEEFPEIIIHDPVPEEPEYKEPKSLSDALQDIKLDGIIEHMESAQGDSEIKSYDDVFSKSEHQFVPQFTVEPEVKNTQGRFFKIFLYLFFIFLLSAFSFYIYKTMFTKSSSNQVIDTLGIQRIDSVRALLNKTGDTTSKSDSTKLREGDESDETESVEIKNLYGVVYREFRGKVYIQNKVVDDLNDANELELKLKSNNLNCIIEGGTKIDNGLEYRVLIGPFVNIEEAMAYYEKHKVILNFIQIMHPSQPNLLVF